MVPKGFKKQINSNWKHCFALLLLNCFSWKIIARLSCTVNTMVADGLATQGTKASATRLLIYMQRSSLRWRHNGRDSITSLTIVYSTVYSDADQRNHQGSASLAFVWGIHRGPVISPHKWPVTRKMFPFDDVTMSPGSSSTMVCNGSIWTLLPQVIIPMVISL